VDLHSAVLIGLPTIALMMLSETMARARNRSVSAWVSVSMIIGPLPLVPLVLYLLGSREGRA